MSSLVTLERLPDSKLVPKAVLDVLQRIASFPEVRSIVVFGSRAIGDADPRSDVDVCVSAPNIDLRKWLEIKRIAEEARTLLWITVVHFENSPPALQKRNLADGVLVYERTKTA